MRRELAIQRGGYSGIYANDRLNELQPAVERNPLANGEKDRDAFDTVLLVVGNGTPESGRADFSGVRRFVQSLALASITLPRRVRHSRAPRRHAFANDR